MIKKSIHSLASKLIITIACLMFAGSTIFGYIFIRYEENVLMKNLINYAGSSADLAKKAVYYGMLTRHREAIQQTVEVIGKGEDIQVIRVFNSKGKIFYSSKRAEIGLQVDKNSPVCRSCHSNPQRPRETLFNKKNWSITDNKGVRLLKFVVPIYNEPSCYTAACHVHQKGQRVLGLLETEFSTTTVDAAIERNRLAIILYGASFIFVISISLCIILYIFVSKPVALLEEGMKRLGKGDLDYAIPIQSKDEMGLLARTFNSMSKDIKAYRENMENWTKTLEEEVRKKTAEIMKTQEQMIASEKLASLGRMAAGVAHELNSPLTGIVTFAHLMLKRTPPGNKLDREDLEVIIEQAERCSKIIKGLLGFSRSIASEKTEMDVNETLRHTLDMVQNQAKFHNIKIIKEIDSSLPPIAGDASQLEQVFLNLLINAADAMNDRGTINIATRTISEDAEGYIEIEFTDTGPGISEDYIGKIFEPFFTTKPVGKGTGLGLAVSHGIVKKHGGYIHVESRPGKGASFFVRLPVNKSS